MIPNVALGAILAAIIAALVSLLGLIISKEQKTSEFRQAWIDALRAELTSYVTHINAALDGNQVVYKTHADKIAALSPHYAEINNANFSIQLRLNHTETMSANVLSCMTRFNELISSGDEFTTHNLRPIESDFIQHSNDLLKYEWKRVKRGEVTFVVSKFVAASVVIVALIFGAVAFYGTLTLSPTPALPSAVSRLKLPNQKPTLPAAKASANLGQSTGNAADRQN